MITYNRTAFGLNLIFRVHGSAVYRAVFPSLVAVAIFLLLNAFYEKGGDFGEEVGHPYVIGALVASASFLVVFRANQGYARYWEACGAVHHMTSKWMDATMHTCVYHMQCDHYKDMKPPSYFDYPELNHLYLTRDRERGVDFDSEDNEDDDEQDDYHITSAGPRNKHKSASSGRNGERQSLSDEIRGLVSPLASHRLVDTLRQGTGKARLEKEKLIRKAHAVVKSINKVDVVRPPRSNSKKSMLKSTSALPPNDPPPIQSSRRSASADDISNIPVESCERLMDRLQLDAGALLKSQPGTGKPSPLWGRPRLDGNWTAYYTQDEGTPLATFADPNDGSLNGSSLPPEGFASTQGGRTPPLFLQELAHLSSLMVAVALSTLRNDIDGSESPLTFYDPGSPWPTLDPDNDEWMKVSKGLRQTSRNILSFLGMGRSPMEQTRYNAGRPLPVIGGVSDAEIRFLQMARGPYAKTMLCWNWLSEFVIREHLAGTLGKVGPPIISRIIQFLGDGMIYYNHARKIMFIPFPFVHAQLSVMFIIVMIFFIPLLMDQYTDKAWMGALLTFFTVLCLAGVNEVARELENPFRNVPNELPLVTFQAQFNEALITMYSGYHPDHFWDGDRVLRKRTEAANTASGSTATTTATATASVPSSPKTSATAKTAAETMSSAATAVPPQAPQLNGQGLRFRGASAASKNEGKYRVCSGGCGEFCAGSCGKNKTAVGSSSPTAADVSGQEEIAQLKEQLAHQANLIEQLFAKMSASDPAQSTKENDDIINC